MKKSILISAAIVSLAMLASCQKEQFTENAAPAMGVTEFFATIEQTTKTAIDVDGKVSWKVGDEITVTDAASNTAVYVAGSDGASTTFTLKTGEIAVGDGPYSATYGDIDNQIYDEDGANCPLTAPETGTPTFSFSSPYAVVKITAKSDGGEVIKSVSVSYGGNDYTLDCGDGVTLTSDGNDFYVAVEPATDAALSVTFHTDGKTATKTRKSAVTLVAKDLLPVTFAFAADDWESLEADIPEPLKGVFTVSDNGTPNDPSDDVKVHFSQGNLQATYNSSTSSYTWGFAANQYDYIGNAAGNTTISSQTNGAIVDLFGWSTASTNYGIDTSVDDGTYSGDFKNWGTAIDDKGIWRTLSKEEWQYLAHTRTVNNDTGEGKSYQRATINSDAAGVYGMILYPDNYTGTAKTSYSSTEWTSLEEAGCVFLPAAGSRYRSSVTEVGGNGSGNYWSSTAYFGQHAYYMQFTSSSVSSSDNNSGRFYGHSVRLVTNVSAAPTPADGTRGTLNGHEYVVVAGVKWATQNLAITESGNKKWKGRNTGENPEVKVPGTDDDVIVGDYFQWAAYENYAPPVNNFDNGETDKGLLIYTSFTNTHCVDGGNEDKFEFKSPETDKTYRFNTAPSPYYSDETAAYISPYYATVYTRYNEVGTSSELKKDDDVAHIILGGNWRMPTKDEFQALHDATYWAWDDADKGYYVFTPGENHTAGTNAASIPTGLNKSDALLFFPATGGGSGSSISNAGVDGRYWSSTLYDNTAYQGYTNYAHDLYVYMTGVSPQAASFRYLGRPIRPVSD